MSVSTIFLQTTNEGANEYGDTTFSIHVPAMDKSYKLQLASFMFRPKMIILEENEYITIRLNYDIYKHVGNDWTLLNRHLEGREISKVTLRLFQPYQFAPSKIEHTEMSNLFVRKGEEVKDLQLTWSAHFNVIDAQKQKHPFTFQYALEDMKWDISSDYKLEWHFTNTSFDHDNIYQLLNWNDVVDDWKEKCSGWLCELEDIVTDLKSIEIIDITPGLAHFSGLSKGIRSTMVGDDLVITGDCAYNPHYWNYITLSCNKSYNTGNVVNQERFNTDIDDSSQFYKGQILGYMPNNAYAPEAMQTGMATANEYLIQPADFNSIRFWLNYDNGEPVKLCSPMTIVLNMMPNQG